MNSENDFRERVISGVQQAYDTIAGHFSATRQQQWEEVEYLVEQYVRPGQTLLDIGCGNGRVAQIASRIKAKYVGTDISAEMIRIAKEINPEGEFAVADMRSLPFADRSVDHIIGVASFHHLPDEQSRLQALEEMTRVVRPGGCIILLNWNLRRPKMLQLRLHSLTARWRDGKTEYGWNDILVPWRDSQRNQLAERYYHAFSRGEMRRLGKHTPGLLWVDDYYEDRGLHVPRYRGANLVSVFVRAQ